MHPAVRAILQAGTALVKAMRIATSTTTAETCAFYKNSILNSTKQTVCEGRIKCETSGSQHSIFMQLANGAKYGNYAIKSGSVVCNFAGTSPYTHSLDTSIDHTYKMVFNATTNCEFYVDDVLIHTALYSNLITTTVNAIYFGDVSNAVNSGGSTVWKSLRYNLDLAGTPTSFVEWDPASKPTSQGWTLFGTDLATLIEV